MASPEVAAVQLALHFEVPMLSVLAVTSLLLVTHPGADDFPSDLRRWYVTDPPKLLSPQWHVAQQDFEREWVVIPNGATPRVELFDRTAGPKPLPFDVSVDDARSIPSGWHIHEKVEDGWIVAFNRGEFGGSVWWFSPDGKTRIKISEEISTKFFRTDRGLLALEGIPHGLGLEGKIARLFKGKDGRWNRETFLDLGKAPYTATRDTEGSLIVATDQLIRIELSTGKKSILLSDGFWSGLYPDSMVMTDSGDLYLGMRHGVFKLSKAEMRNHGRGKWLLPSESVAKQVPKEGFR